MLNFLKKLFKISMDTEEENYDMLDILAFNCNELMEKVSNSDISTDEKNSALFDYIRKADAEHKSINDFKEDLDWFNVTEPLSFEDTLLGKIVILDFFTYCCINCMHILPDLKKLEQLYRIEDGLVVIGVHSAKFDNEKDSANILSAVQRYDITHPVVNDSASSMWIDLKIKCWPTLLILGPRANPLFVLMGEGHYDLLEKYIGTAIKFYRNKNALLPHSLPLNPSTELLMKSHLKFPGKITSIADPLNQRELFAISDSGNHRILIIDEDGQLIEKIGGKLGGFVDGAFEIARFDSPQGVAFQNVNVLFVADTENHAIRQIDLRNRIVCTVAGTGGQGNDRVGGKIGTEQEISSPWDIAIYRTRDMDMSFHFDEENIPEKDIVLVAAAGTHQIWAIFLDDVIWWKFKKFTTGTVVSIAGNGQEENRNNSYPYNAGFAQPSGLSIDMERKELYIADSESSCIRKLCLTDGKVFAVAGGERNPLNLFAFGDVDGKQYGAKLQHPLAVTFNPKDNYVYVADTYNHKIKRININTCVCSTMNIIDQLGNLTLYNEPGGICVNSTGDKLFVADTNNHSIEVIDLNTMSSHSLKIKTHNAEQKNIDQNEQTLKSELLKISPKGGLIKLKITLNTVGVSLANDAPHKWSIKLPNDTWTTNHGQSGPLANEYVELSINVPSLESSQIEEIISISFKLILCASEICYPRTFSLILMIVYDNEASEIINYNLTPIVSKKDIKL